MKRRRDEVSIAISTVAAGGKCQAASDLPALSQTVLLQVLRSRHLLYIGYLRPKLLQNQTLPLHLHGIYSDAMIQVTL